MEDGSDNGPITARDGLAPDTVLADRYRIVRTLASGGMGRLLVARHTELERDVVVKVMLAELVHDELMRARFFREAKLLAALESDHVVKILDVGRLDDDTPYLVMELLDGEDLEARCERGPIAVRDAVRFIIEACAGLAEAHAIGVIHRDVKPQNLFVARSRSGVERIKVLDFGIAKRTANMTASKGGTTGESMIGPPAFMAPEQITSSRDVDARADIWSLGATLYQLLAGSPPFRGDDNIKVLAAILHGPVPPIRVARPEVSRELAEIVEACLQKKPADRPQTVTELAARLEALEDVSAPKRPPERTRRPRTPVMLVAFLTTVVVGGSLGTLAWRPWSPRTIAVVSAPTTTAEASVAPSAVVSSVESARGDDAPPAITTARRTEPSHRLALPKPSPSVTPADESTTTTAGSTSSGPHPPVFMKSSDRRELKDEEAAVIFGSAFENSMRACVKRSGKYASGAFSVNLSIRLSPDHPKVPHIDLFWNCPHDSGVTQCILGVVRAVPWQERSERNALRLALSF